MKNGASVFKDRRSWLQGLIKMNTDDKNLRKVVNEDAGHHSDSEVIDKST